MVVIRLARSGAKKRPFFNMVVADSRNRRDGRFIERIGYYNPVAAESEKGLVINTERLAFWQGHGAQLSPTAARLVKQAAMAAGVRADLSEAERKAKFAGHSLRAGLASSAEVDERYVQKQLGHASAEMTRRYQRRRDKFRVNLTKAAGL